MSLGKYKHIILGLAVGGLLLAGLFLLPNGAPNIARADPVDLFVTTDGSGTACTQAVPCSLQDALGKAVSGNTIYVAQGIYAGTGSAVVTVTQSITLAGGWNGAPAGDVVRDPNAYPTTLDGENARRGVYISGDITPTLDGLIVTRGNASNVTADPGHGGGIYSSSANPIVTNNVITDNVAYTSTTSWAHGGGIYIGGGYGTPVVAVLSGNLIANNMASTAYRGEGGGLEVQYGSGVIVSHNTFRGNIAGIVNGMGGGLSLYSSSSVVNSNVIHSNQATPTNAGFGGGFYSHFGDVLLSGNIVISNAAQYGAVTFESNTNVTLTNNIIAQNPAGGVFVRGTASSPLAGILVHNTIAQNGKEGVYAGWYNSGYSTLTLTNNIIVSHTTGIYAHPDPNPNAVTAAHTLFYGNGADTDGSTITSTDEITGSDPLFLDPAGWDYHILPGSPAIDAGAAIPWLTTDVDGEARPWPTGGDCDIGADEAYWRRVYIPLVLKGSD